MDESVRSTMGWSLVSVLLLTVLFSSGRCTQLEHEAAVARSLTREQLEEIYLRRGFLTRIWTEGV